jgi:hypothetical protein
MALPVLLLVIAIGQTIAARLESITLGGLFAPGVVALGVVIGLFSWFYPARVVRTLTQSLREYEFVEAARMTGSRDLRILRRHIVPHLAGPLIVWATLVAASVIVLEAALSVLNFGIKLGTATWGSLLSDAWGSLLVFNPNATAPQYPRSGWLMLWPSLTLFLTCSASRWSVMLSGTLSTPTEKADAANAAPPARRWDLPDHRPDVHRVRRRERDSAASRMRRHQLQHADNPCGAADCAAQGRV